MNSFSRARKASLGMTAVLAIAVAAGAGFAFFNAHAAPATTVRPEIPSNGSETRAAPPRAEQPSVSLSGSVLETIAASSYTYLRLATDNGEIWAAVPSTSVAVGTKVTLENTTKMTAFKSSTLKRTFDVIYFGTLANGAPKPEARRFSPADALAAADDDEQDLPPGHPDVSGSPLAAVGSPDTLPAGHPSVDGAAVSPHGSAPSSAGSALPELTVAPARGNNARVIAQLSLQRAQLNGQTVRVRGQVTKVTPGVQGHTFFHLRDGKPGDQPASDLVVTSNTTPDRGQVATFEGTLRTDVDLGIGYSYPILLENAVLVAE
jgi:hypothetical protein